ncbi:MAG: alginate export family protein [Pseudomonadota bacterium]
MLTVLLLVVLVTSEPKIDVQPRTPGTVQDHATRAFLPQDEDWRIRGADVPPLKSRRLTPNGSITTSVGLDARLHFEHFQNEAFGNIPDRDVSIFLLATPWASATFNDRVRIYSALKHASVQGRNGPKPGAISDSLDLHQGFLEVAAGDALGQSRNDLLIRVGRQELHYGAGRVLAIRAGRFIRDDYDGMMVRYRRGSWVTDAFGFVGVEDGDGSFDNHTDDSVSFSGVYSSGGIRGINLDLYGLSWRRDDVPTSAGPSEIIRHYTGARAYGQAFEHWSWDIEGTVQSGSVDATDEEIRGFQVGGRLTRSLLNVPGSPRPTIEFLHSTGDDDPTDGQVTSFLVPAASGLVYEDVTQPLGPGNLTWAKVSVPFQIGGRLRVTPYVHAFWRAERADALYTLFNTELLPGNTGDGNFVGVDSGFTARFSLTESLVLIAYGGHFDAGGVFSGTGRDASGNSAMLGVTYRY